MKYGKITVRAAALLAAVFAASCFLGTAACKNDKKGAEDEDVVHEHEYAVTEGWTWSPDYSSCTAETVCVASEGTCDSPGGGTLSAVVTSEVTAEATCTSRGSVTYTATYEGRVVGTRDAATDKLNHVYDDESESWEWWKNKKGAGCCALTLACSVCGDAWRSDDVVGERVGDTDEYTATVKDLYGNEHESSHAVTDADETKHVHDYEVTKDWEWTSDYECVRTRTCQMSDRMDCDEETRTDTAVISSVTEKVENCTETGTVTHTASYLGETVGTAEETVEALGHDYSDSWEWSPDPEKQSVTGTCTLTCSRDDDVRVFENVKAAYDYDFYVHVAYAVDENGCILSTGIYVPTAVGLTFTYGGEDVSSATLAENEEYAFDVTVNLSDGKTNYKYDLTYTGEDAVEVYYEYGLSEVIVDAVNPGTSTITVTAEDVTKTFDVTVEHVDEVTTDFADPSSYAWIRDTSNGQTWSKGMLTLRTTTSTAGYGSYFIYPDEGYMVTCLRSRLNTYGYFEIDLTDCDKKYVSVEVVFGANGDDPGYDTSVYLVTALPDGSNPKENASTTLAYEYSESTSDVRTLSLVLDTSVAEKLYIVQVNFTRIYSVSVVLSDDLVPNYTPPTSLPVSVEITLEGEENLCKAGGTAVATATVTMSDGGAYEGGYTWASNYFNRASVTPVEGTNTAIVTAVADGDVRIICTVDENVRGEISLTIGLDPEILATKIYTSMYSGDDGTEFELNLSSLQSVGDSVTVYAAIGLSKSSQGWTYDGEYAWESSDPSVVTVTPVEGTGSAVITVTGYGTATVSVTVGEGVTDSCTVTVSEPQSGGGEDGDGLSEACACALPCRKETEVAP